MFDTLKSKTMDYKSMLIGGLATALLFVSIGAGVQSEPTTIQVTENPYPYELKVNYDDATKALLLNRETGRRVLFESKFDVPRNQICRIT